MYSSSHKNHLVYNVIMLNTLTEKKAKLDQHRPLPIEITKNLDDWFQVELTYTSNALEGNTLTRQETAQVIEKGITIGGKSLREHLEATNHAKAWNWILQNQETPITEESIQKIHSLILAGIDDPNAGHYRQVPVRISGSTVILPNYLKVPALMTEFNTWLTSHPQDHPVQIAAEAHYQLVTIHPFIDGNGRTGRLLMNAILHANGYPPAIIKPEERITYINSLEQAQLGGSKEPFHTLVQESVNRSLDIYLESLT